MYKKVLMGLCAFVISSILYAENAKNDVIYTRDNKKIEAIIKEMSKDVIKYIEADNVDGPLYILSTDEINLIELRNGKIQTFNPNVNQPVVENQQVSTPTNQQTNTPTKQQTNTPASNTLVQKDFTIKKKTRFQSNIDLGGVITEESGIVAGGVLFDVGAGARITDYFYIGATLGLHSEWAEIGYAKSSALVLPIYADLRGYIPNKSNVLSLI